MSLERGTALQPVSVVICTCGRPDSVGAAVESALSQDHPDFEVVVLDQSSDRETEEVVRSIAGHHPMVRYLRLAERGLSRAYNRGVKEARFELIAFTDDDCVAAEDWLRVLERAFHEHPEVGLIYGQVLGPKDPADGRFGEGVIPTLPFDGRRLLSHRDGFRVFGMGANFAARRSVLERLGGFDEVLGGGGPLQSAQDFDLAYRLYRERGTILLEPAAVVHHYGFRTHQEWPATAESYGIGVGGFYFKHIRTGDIYALWLLFKATARVAGRMTKRFVHREPTAIDRTFLQAVARGMRASRCYAIDRRLRVYRTEAG